MHLVDGEQGCLDVALVAYQINRLQDFGQRAEAGMQRQLFERDGALPGADAEIHPGFGKQRRLGALERIDRLLLVAHRKERARPRGPRRIGEEFVADGAHHAPLLGIGILAFIDKNVVDAGIELTGAQIGAFFCGAAQEGREHYGKFASAGFDEAFAALDVRRICAPAFLRGETVRLDNIAVEQGYDGTPFTVDAIVGNPVIRSLMAVPVLLRNGDTHGVLVFGHDRSGAFNQRSERLLAGLTAQAAIALENSRLYRNAQNEIEDRKQAQTQQSLLIRELHHRVKNTLATVQAVVGATARSALSIDDFYQAFVGRIISLANTHSLLTEAVWQTASLRDIMEKELRPYNDVRAQRITLTGPAVELPSEAAVPIGMAIHELTTNAAKYGALSVSRGKVAVSWETEPAEEGTRLRLVWVESGGPEVTAPTRQGFGSRLLHRVLATQLNAKVEMDFRPEGLRVALDAVLRHTPVTGPSL